MAENILILAPVAFKKIPADRNALIAMLKESRFIGDSLEVSGEKHYRPGEDFMMLMTFLGCSPMIATGEMDSNGEQYCHIAIEGPLQEPRYIVGDNIKTPRCPSCGHRFDDWRSLLESWQESPEDELACPGCNEHYSATRLRWRKSAGFGRFFIKVWGIFESEAVPSPNLLTSLKNVSGTEWRHFFIRKN